MKKLVLGLVLVALCVGSVAHADPFRMLVLQPLQFITSAAATGISYDGVTSAVVTAGADRSSYTYTQATGSDTTEWQDLRSFEFPGPVFATTDTAAALGLLISGGAASGDTSAVTIQTCYDPAGTITTSFTTLVIGTGQQYVKAVAKNPLTRPPLFVRAIVNNYDISSQITRTYKVQPIVYIVPNSAPR